MNNIGNNKYGRSSHCIGFLQDTSHGASTRWTLRPCSTRKRSIASFWQKGGILTCRCFSYTIWLILNWYIGHKWLHCDPHHGGVRQHQHVRHGGRVRRCHQHWEQPRIDSSDHSSISGQVMKTDIFCKYLEDIWKIQYYLGWTCSST